MTTVSLTRQSVQADALPIRDTVLVVSGALLTALFAQISINVALPSAWGLVRRFERR